MRDKTCVATIFQIRIKGEKKRSRLPFSLVLVGSLIFGQFRPRGVNMAMAHIYESGSFEIA
jgi:hypothetical protein